MDGTAQLGRLCAHRLEQGRRDGRQGLGKGQGLVRVSVDVIEVAGRLREVFALDTSESPKDWSEERPSTGHCAIVSVILRALFGGQIVRGVSSQGVVHYWNYIDGITLDATRDQFDPGESFTQIMHDPSPSFYLHLELVEKLVRLLQRADVGPLLDQ